MRTNLILLSILFSTSIFSQAMEDKMDMNDRAAIEKTLNNYLIGGTERNVERVVSAFHPEARMQYVTDEGYKNVNAKEFFGKGKSGGEHVNRKTFIEDIKVDGHVASAKLRIDYPTFSFHDHMQLLKVDGEWLIVGKIFYKELKQ